MGNKKSDQQSSSPDNGPAKSAGFSLSPAPLVGVDAPAPAAAHEAHALPEFESLGELPVSYHEDTLFLVARDPRWLFSYWDFDWTKIQKIAFRFGVPMFFLKIWRADGAEETTVEVRPEARNWYVPVGAPDTEYSAELGYYGTDGAWIVAVKSKGARTPPEALADEQHAAEFVTLPAGMSFEQMLALVSERMAAGESLLQAIARITGSAVGVRAGEAPEWTDEQRRLLATLLGHTVIDRMGLGSAEIDQLLRKQLLENLGSESASGLGAIWRSALAQAGGESSLFSGVTSWQSSWPTVPRGFFMHVNAEVIFYGGTDPKATVWIDGRQIRLEPDGTFRHHFRMPDGDWVIPIVARSPDGVEERSATLNFARGTSRVGEVGATAQPPGLAPEPMGRRG